MKKKLTILTIILTFQLSIAYTQKMYTGKTVGLKSQCVVKEGKKYNIISIPFIKPSIHNGDIEAINPDTFCLIDNDKFTKDLHPEKNYILLMTDGKMAGEWFFLSTNKTRKAKVNSSSQIFVDPFKSSTSDLSGISSSDSYEIHPLYDLTELFPEDGSILPAGNFDYEAGRIQLLSNDQKTTLWLSNGNITSQKGWIRISQNNVNKQVDHFSILPGRAMIIFHPKPEKDMYVYLTGEALELPVSKPIYPGKNLISVEYQLSSTYTSNRMDYSLDELNLIENGFVGGKTIDESDKVKIWNQEQSSYGDGIWLLRTDNDVNEWLTEYFLTPSFSVIQPGGGILVQKLDR